MNLAELTLLIHAAQQGLQIKLGLFIPPQLDAKLVPPSTPTSTNISQHQPTSATIKLLSSLHIHPSLGYSTSPFWNPRKSHDWTNRPHLQPGNAFLQLLSNPASSWISCFSALRSICLPRIADPGTLRGPGATPMHRISHRWKKGTLTAITVITVLYYTWTMTIPVLDLQDWRKMRKLSMKAICHIRYLSADQLPSATRASIRDPICASPA